MKASKLRQIVLLAMMSAAAVVVLTPALVSAQGVPPVVWNKSAFPFDNGQAPSVAVSGLVIVEVREDGSGGLWSLSGKIQEDGSVKWAKTPFMFDNGYAPSVAITGNTIVEVHQGGTGEGQLMFHTGKITLAGEVIWAGASAPYDTAWLPRSQ